MPIRIVLADDHVLVRQSLKSLIGAPRRNSQRESRLPSATSSVCRAPVSCPSSNRFVFGVADLFQLAHHAFGLARLADSPPVPDQLMRKLDPPVFRDHLHQVQLNFLGVLVARQIQPVRQTLHVRIDHDSTGDSKRCPEHHVRRLPCHSLKRQQFLHRARHLPAEFLNDCFARAHDRFRLVPEKSCRSDLLLQLFRIRIGERFGILIFFIKRFAHLINAHVRALRGEYRGDQQLECVLMLQLTSRVRIRFVELCKDRRNALWAGSRRSRSFGSLRSLCTFCRFVRSWFPGGKFLLGFLGRHGTEEYHTSRGRHSRQSLTAAAFPELLPAVFETPSRDGYADSSLLRRSPRMFSSGEENKTPGRSRTRCFLAAHPKSRPPRDQRPPRLSALLSPAQWHTQNARPAPHLFFREGRQAAGRCARN